MSSIDVRVYCALHHIRHHPALGCRQCQEEDNAERRRRVLAAEDAERAAMWEMP